MFFKWQFSGIQKSWGFIPFNICIGLHYLDVPQFVLLSPMVYTWIVSCCLPLQIKVVVRALSKDALGIWGDVGQWLPKSGVWWPEEGVFLIL
jgi:hypothetical protein